MSGAVGHQADIRKMGYLKKLKTMKKKLFLLRDDSTSGPARLEYHDTEKKFKSGANAKRSIVLKTCFNINKKSDSKHKHAIALYTKDDCFSVICENENEQEEWLATMLELQNILDESGQPRPLFEHIWQVGLKSKGLCNGKNLVPGQYRLCLTNDTVSLVRLYRDEPDII
jgi:insulin receptor substrate 1